MLYGRGDCNGNRSVLEASIERRLVIRPGGGAGFIVRNARGIEAVMYVFSYGQWRRDCQRGK